jgi:mannose-6-phosphate isomerase-like protein (cupin superfamily)
VANNRYLSDRAHDKKGHFCLNDMFVPVVGRPYPHRHDFEETFVLIEGSIGATFRGKEQVVRTGETIRIPSKAPRQFDNRSDRRLSLKRVSIRQIEFLQERGKSRVLVQALQ